ncbi:hypothetical protein [Colletotrichum camelliae filamentous virus 1]|uniref:Uncharacterized protein n=1 Tax=Colletotrichum camelliae filamentous virus 1 TaxID=2029458 RepID=A0A286M3N2_9VIRU|nr:hypothetical protein QK579_s5gp1 [Colletotrichum camelliae filamentous virus 1]ASV63096.1 hypothetical protein [Colletotrichum camelliae filamentous virus 1]
MSAFVPCVSPSAVSARHSSTQRSCLVGGSLPQSHERIVGWSSNVPSTTPSNAGSRHVTPRVVDVAPSRVSRSTRPAPSVHPSRAGQTYAPSKTGSTATAQAPRPSRSHYTDSVAPGDSVSNVGRRATQGATLRPPSPPPAYSHHPSVVPSGSHRHDEVAVASRNPSAPRPPSVASTVTAAPRRSVVGRRPPGGAAGPTVATIGSLPRGATLEISEDWATNPDGSGVYSSRISVSSSHSRRSNGSRRVVETGDSHRERPPGRESKRVGFLTWTVGRDRRT